ncbi:RNA-binding RNA processing protein rpp1 [Batrachochytrium dendrobatidis]|nr:RNA-binding RNA processing protein rpp1 [Batrachochytrium dendrobatidis]KAK5667005.1 RNA-binding RNA processing protein rpp1 [Batrachochytrium dendrobatidis]
MFDLNIPESSLTADWGSESVLGMLVRLGYRGVAISVTCSESLAKLKPCSIDKEKCAALVRTVANPSTIVRVSPPLLAQTLPHSIASKTFDIFTRLSISLDNPSHNYSITHGNNILKSYDIISVQPTSEKLFQSACQNLDVDIISLDMGTRLPFFLRHPTVNSAIQRGIMFEICYSQGIRDQTARANLIANAAALVRITKGKHVILSSEARHAFELRAPADVINLASLFSLNPVNAKTALTVNVRSVLVHAATRKDTFRGVMSMEIIDQSGEPERDEESETAGQKWKMAKVKESEFISFADFDMES